MTWFGRGPGRDAWRRQSSIQQASSRYTSVWHSESPMHFVFGLPALRVRIQIYCPVNSTNAREVPRDDFSMLVTQLC